MKIQSVKFLQFSSKKEMLSNQSQISDLFLESNKLLFSSAASSVYCHILSRHPKQPFPSKTHFPFKTSFHVLT